MLCPLYCPYSIVCISFWRLVFALPGWEVLLPRTPADNCLILVSYVLPDKFSILTYAWSSYSPVTRSFHVCEPNRTPCSPMSSAVFVWAIVWNRPEEAIWLVPFSDPFYLSSLFVFGSIPRFPDSQHILLVDAARCPASRTVNSCPCSPVGNLCSLLFVCSKSWITMCHANLAPSDVPMLRPLLHPRDLSTSGWSCITRTSRGLFSAIAIIYLVPYTRRLKALCVSSCFLGSIYANSSA